MKKREELQRKYFVIWNNENGGITLIVSRAFRSGDYYIHSFDEYNQIALETSVSSGVITIIEINDDLDTMCEYPYSITHDEEFICEISESEYKSIFDYYQELAKERYYHEQALKHQNRTK